VPFTADDFIQFDEGSVAATASCVVTLPVGTTVGNTVIVFIQPGGTSITPAAGFAVDTVTVLGVCVYHKLVTASETSWTFTQNSAQDAVWVVLEMSNVDPDEPYETFIAAGPTTLSTGGTQSTGTTAFNVGLSTVEFAAFSATTSTAVKSWGSYTNGFEEVTQYDAPAGASRPCLAVARKFTDAAPGLFESTGTVTLSTGTASCRGKMVVFRAAGSPISAPLTMLTGFEFGTHGGLAETVVHSTGGNQPLGPSTNPPVGTWGTHYLIQAGSARNGDYGLRISTSAAICNVPIYSTIVPSVYGQSLRVVSGSGTPTVMTFDIFSSATDLLLVYDFSTNKYGLQWVGGSVAWQSGTTALNTWVWVEVRVKMNATTWQADWILETGTDTYTEQTSPADLTGQTATTLTKVTLSGLTSQTITMDADDPICSAYFAAWPLDFHRVIRLGVDPAGTPTVSGTSSNFSTFTANGTLAAWNATTARDALDEVPPTVSASADGVVQTAVAATDYMEFPMATYTLASDERIAGVRMIAAMWGGTGTGTGTLGIKGWDGVTLTSLAPNTTVYDAASPTAVSATEPLWMAYPWNLTPGNPWTQAKLDAAVIRIGYSSDATPDMGVSAVYLEVAIRKTQTERQITAGDNDEFTVDVRLDPFNSASVSYVVGSTHATLGATFNYSVSGTPQTPVYCSPSSTQEVVVNAASFGDISDVSLEPDAV
jgi:hypothetical protein